MIENEKYQLPDSLMNAQWLPVIDWNIKFFGAHQQSVKRDWEVPKEAHIGFEIMLIIEGSQETVLENQPYLLQSEDILLIPPGFRHTNRYVSEEGMVYFCAHFNIDDPLFRLEMIKNNRIFFPAGTVENGKLRKVLNHWIEMVQEKGQFTTADRFRLQAILLELLGVIAEFVGQIQDEEHRSTPTSVKYAKAIADAIKEKFNPHKIGGEEDSEKAIRIEEIIASLGISPGYGHEVFRKVYGISPRQYLSELKLHEAKALIQQPDLSLGEIATLLGYSHLSHFSRQFKRWTGMSPMEYRKR